MACGTFSRAIANVVGRCWNRDELLDLASFAEENDLIVCSDEIHCGLRPRCVKAAS